MLISSAIKIHLTDGAVETALWWSLWYSPMWWHEFRSPASVWKACIYNSSVERRGRRVEVGRSCSSLDNQSSPLICSKFSERTIPIAAGTAIERNTNISLWPVHTPTLEHVRASAHIHTQTQRGEEGGKGWEESKKYLERHNKALNEFTIHSLSFRVSMNI